MTNRPLDVRRVREEYPILARQIDGRPIVYLDSAATALKPRAVIDAVVAYYTQSTANVHRGVYRLSEEASQQYDDARQTVADFLGAEAREIVFVRNATEAIGLVAMGIGDLPRTLTTLAEHHSNQLPWRARENCELVSITGDGRMDLEDLERRLRAGPPALVAVSSVSNALGAVNPIDEIVPLVHRHGGQVLVDASQSVPHQPTDVGRLGCDYLAFSGHKLGAPTGSGVLFGRRERLEALVPRMLGGDTVEAVHADGWELQGVPNRFEAGTPAIESAIGLAAACRFLESLGMETIAAHSQALTDYALAKLGALSGLTIWGPHTSGTRGPGISFTLANLEANAVARLLSNRHNICVRSGFHCAQPAHELLGVAATVRASFYVYNTEEEIDLLAAALEQILAAATRA